MRTLTDVELFDVSIVTYPAYPQTSAEARSMAASLSEAGSDDHEKQAEGTGAEARPASRKRQIEIMRLRE